MAGGTTTECPFPYIGRTDWCLKHVGSECPARKAPVRRHMNRTASQSALTMFSTIFLASENSIMVFSRKKSSFSTPA